MDVWLHHDGHGDEASETLRDSLCAVIFNAQGLLRELLVSDKVLAELIRTETEE